MLPQSLSGGWLPFGRVTLHEGDVELSGFWRSADCGAAENDVETTKTSAKRKEERPVRMLIEKPS
jgi:hypothetical protein